jgi:arginyl-tRNA synthetase
MIAEEVGKIVKEALRKLGLSTERISIEHPADISHGDYSTNAALILARKLKEKPRDIAEKIVGEIQKGRTSNSERGLTFGDIAKIEVAGAGFINFYLSPKFFAESLQEVLEKGSNFGRGEKYGGKTVLAEYTDPNAFKVFHIGHLMSNAIGEAISRIISFSDAKVVRICYPSDAGLHIAKAVWAMRQNLKELPKEKDTLATKADFLGKCYVEGTRKYEADEKSKKEINIVNKILFEKSDKEILGLYEMGRNWSLEHLEEIYRKLGTKFDVYIYESEAGPRGEKIVKDFLTKGIFEKSDGATVFRGEKYGLHTRVFINSEGFPVYEAKEVGLNVMKFEKYPDTAESIIITGNEQNDYFKVIIKVLGLIDEKIGARTKHFGHGMLRFAEGKMSSRTGNVITGESLLSDVEKLVEEKIADRDFNGSEKEKVGNAVSVGAIKYSVLKQATGSNIMYDFEKSISFEGDSGPYLQYSYARAMSVLRKAEGVKRGLTSPRKEVRPLGLPNYEPGELERLLYRFPEIVERAASEYEPHYIVTYLTELAGAFNSYYAKNLILGAGEATPYRLALTKAFTIVMKNGLNLLAIPVLEKM